MKPHFQLAHDELKKLGVNVFSYHDQIDNFNISAEGGHDEGVEVAYYGPGDFPYSDPRIEAILDKHGLFAEWVNPAYLSVYEK